MAYNPEIAERIAEILAETPGITSKQMFGGLSFMLNGNMLIGVDKERLMVRIGKERYEEYLQLEGAQEMDFTKKPMKGFLFIDETGFSTDKDLETWIDRCVDFVSTLPNK
jgi:TfoX/Sxy family transcriptional regulator of competence genes